MMASPRAFNFRNLENKMIDKAKKNKKRENFRKCIDLSIPTAVLVDGGFFLRRYKSLYEANQEHTPEQIVKNLIRMAVIHANKDNGSLYRMFFYDCKPYGKKQHNPITKKAIDFSKTPEAVKRNAIHELLKKERKVALRYGEIKDGNGWSLYKNSLNEILKGNKEIKDLTEKDVFFDMSQKGVDMKIGLDIASLAYKKLVKRIVLVSGDSDFVPAAKLARKEGIDFILDPIWNNIHENLYEHIDGLTFVLPKPNKKSI